MWVEEEEWAYPIVYRPVSVDDEEVCEASSWKKEKKGPGSGGSGPHSTVNCAFMFSLNKW